jgi:hypothetical protein
MQALTAEGPASASSLACTKVCLFLGSIPAKSSSCTPV